VRHPAGEHHHPYLRDLVGGEDHRLRGQLDRGQPGRAPPTGAVAAAGILGSGAERAEEKSDCQCGD
jgi:hypothetical protein